MIFLIITIHWLACTRWYFILFAGLCVQVFWPFPYSASTSLPLNIRQLCTAADITCWFSNMPMLGHMQTSSSEWSWRSCFKIIVIPTNRKIRRPFLGKYPISKQTLWLQSVKISVCSSTSISNCKDKSQKIIFCPAHCLQLSATTAF